MKQIDQLKSILTHPCAKKAYWCLFITLLLIYSYTRALKEGIGGDAHVFWQAGHDFITGADLYRVLPGHREFIYPPFAALFFTPLGILPFKLATFMIFAINFLLWFLTFKYIKKICLHFDLQEQRLKIALWISFFISFKLFWNNLKMIQVNGIVFYLAIMGIYFFIKKRQNMAILFIGMATSIKLTPIFLFFWMVFRSKKIGFFLKCCLAGALAVSVPLLLRGFETGVNDITTFYDLIIAKFLSGDVNKGYANQNLGGQIIRMFTDYTEIGKGSYTVINLGLPAAMAIKKFMTIFCFLLLFGSTLYQNIKKIPLNIYEISAYLLCSHLLSGSSWKAHLVSLALVFTALSYDFLSNKKVSINSFLFVFAALMSLTGKEIIGTKGMYLVGGYGGYVFLMLFLLIYYSTIKGPRINKFS